MLEGHNIMAGTAGELGDIDLPWQSKGSSRFSIHGEEHGFPTAIFNGYITVDIALSRDALVEKLQTVDEMRFYFVVPVGK